MSDTISPGPASEVMASRPEILAAFEANAAALVRSLAGEPWADVLEAPDVTLVSTDIPTPAMNLVARSALEPSTADARIREILAAFGPRGMPFSWWVSPSSRPDDLVVRLVRAGLRDTPPTPAMALELAAWTQPPLPHGVTVERVVVHHIWRETAAVMTAGFDLPASLAPILEERFGALLDRPALRWFAARLGGEIVACALAAVDEGVVGIYNVATLPSARGHGAGTAVTAAAVEDGRRDGCRLAILESSAAGYGVYRRLGFEEVGVVRILVGSPGAA